MRKHIQSWLVTFAVIFASSMGFHACGSDAASIFLNLGELSGTLGEGGSVNVISNVASDTCEGDCDGVIPEKYSASASALASESDYLSITIGGGGTYSVNGTLSSTAAEASLIMQINSGEDTDLFTAQAGSVELIPLNNLQVPNVTFGSEGEGEWSNEDRNVYDTQALTNAITAIFAEDGYSSQDIVDEAGDAINADGNDTTRDVALTGHQLGECDNDGSMVRLDQSIVVEIDGDEIVTEEYFIQDVLTFINCEITGDWLGDGMPYEMVTFNGSVTSIDLYTDTEDRSTVNGTIWVDAQDSMSMPFWVDRLNINTREVWDNTSGPGPDEINGGVCYGGNVTQGLMSDSDEDDGCSGDGTFVSATQFSAYMEP